MTLVVHRQLAGAEDLLLGQGVVQQARGPANHLISKLNSSKLPYLGDPGLPGFANLDDALAIPGIAALRKLTPAKTIFLAYHTTVGDGGGGIFYASTGPIGTYVDDDGTVIVPTGGDGSSAFLRSYVGPMSVRWFGVKADGITDDSIVWQHALMILAAKGGGVLTIDVENTGVSYLNSNVRILSNTNVIVNGNIVFGASGRFSIGGLPALALTPTQGLPWPVAVGATVIAVVNASRYTAGSYAKIRGNRDSTGHSVTSEMVYITAVDLLLNTVTLLRPVKSSYATTWPTSPWSLAGNVDVTRIVPLLTTAMPVGAVAGSDVISVAAASLFAVDDLVLLHDDEVGSDTLNNPSRNLMHQETVLVTAVNLVANTITIAHKLHHSFSATYFAVAMKIDDVRNSSIIGAKVTHNATSPSSLYHSFDISYARNCFVDDCHIQGSFATGFGNVGNGFRLDVGLNNVIRNCSVSMPQVTGPAKGYGFTLYGATGCKLINNYASGCRHSFLLFTGTAGNLVANNTSYGCMNSDFDFHGSGERNNVVENNIVVGTTRITADSSGHGAFRLGNSYHLHGAHNNVVRNNTAYNITGIFIDLQVASSGNKIYGNTVHSCVTGIKIGLPGSAGNNGLPRDLTLGATNNQVRNNIIEGCVRGIDIDGKVNKTITRNNVTGNVVIGATADSVFINNAPSNDFDNMQLRPIPVADINNVANWAVRCNSSAFTSMTNLKVVGAQDGIYLSQSPNFSADNACFSSLVNGVTLRTGAADLNANLLNYKAIGYTPKWQLANVVASIKNVTNRTTRMLATLVLPYVVVGAKISPSNIMPISTDGAVVLDMQWTPSSPKAEVLITVLIPYLAISTSDTVSVAMFIDEQLGAGLKLVTVATERVTAGATAGNTIRMSAHTVLSNILNTTAVRILVNIGERSGTKTITIGGKYAAVAQPNLTIEEV